MLKPIVLKTEFCAYPLLIDQHQTLSCKILVKIEVIIHKDLHYTVWQTLEASRILGSCLRCISCTSTLYPLIPSSSERKIIKSLVRPAQNLSSQHLTRWLIYFLIQKLFSLAPYFFNSSKYSFYSFQCYPTQNVGQVWDTVWHIVGWSLNLVNIDEFMHTIYPDYQREVTCLSSNVMPTGR